MTTIMIYPASITCEMVPEWENKFDDELLNHDNDSLNLLEEEEVDPNRFLNMKAGLQLRDEDDDY